MIDAPVWHEPPVGVSQRLRSYGYPRDTASFLDELASRGVCFEGDGRRASRNAGRREIDGAASNR
jgi:hypothetical protein